ncbi:tetratricopeptide repeat-containing diguanylate cyclase [Granulicella sibirica]|uniref:diguanylate cyclase n=1 Tax=Granulicella sibirica TaxID=2479048 RepID=A0A4Q0SVT1_9BACT|nr:GGDEF domain-containing protein [Granulicella sibirica]RXH55205.1 Pole remodelling regulatory diguanylate cyclase [Granulicella sibirica]
MQECRAVAMEDPAKAVSMAQALIHADHLGAVTMIGALDCLGHAQAIAGDSAGAIDAETRALNLLEKTVMPDAERANVLSNAGGVFQMAGDAKQAGKLLAQSLRLATSKDLPDQRIAALIAIADLYADGLEDPLAANPYFRQALDLSKSMGRDQVYIYAYFNFGNNLVKLERYDEALQILDHVVSLAGSQENYARARFRAEATEAQIFVAQKNLSKARELLDHAIAGQQRLGDKQSEAQSLLTRSSLRRAEGEEQAAVNDAERAMNMGKDIDSPAIQIDAMRLQAAIYASQGDAGTALALSRDAKALEAKVQKPGLTRSPSDLDAQLKDQAIQYQNQYLQEQMGIQALSIRRAAMLRNALISVLVAVVCLAGAFFFYQRRISRRFERLSTTDPLSGLLNRREAVRQLGERHQTFDLATGKRTGVFLVDADFFKSVNDRYGHDAGDRVLVELSSRLRAVCRPDDLAARWGGEEFLIAAWNVTPVEATALAERLRATMESRPIRLPGGVDLTVTVSVGFAMYPFFPSAQDESWRDAFYLADRALYSVKDAGRNAWAGVWGTHKEPAVSVRAIHDDPAEAMRSGWIETSASHPGVWRTVLEHAS